MQAASDIFLGWLRVARLDGAGARLLRAPAVGLEDLGDVETMRPGGIAATASCAAGRSRAPTPARATRSRSPPTSAAATCFDRALADFAERYADQNERDHAALAAAVGAEAVPAAG